MKDIKTAANRKCLAAYEIAIKNCIRKNRDGTVRRRVNISEEDAGELVAFYRKYVKDDRASALVCIADASRRAAGRGSAMSVAVFMIILCFIAVYISKIIWSAAFLAFACALVVYLLWVRRRCAQKIWASRKALEGGTGEALEKMCLLLASSPLICAKKYIVGGLGAAALVSAYQLIAALVK